MDAQHLASNPWIAAVVAAGVLALGACAHQPLQTQTLDVRVESEGAEPIGPLACQARNGAGAWAFTAPGTLTVVPTAEPLHIRCQAPQGMSVVPPSVTSLPSPSARERAHEDAATGAKVGAGAGVVLGAAAAPVMGGAFAVALVLGAALKGGEIGGLVGALRDTQRPRYPSPLVLRVERPAAASP